MTRRAAAQDFDPRQYVYGAALVGGAANVIMQLAQRPVGRGVLESTVDSGKATLHPVKRTRTTLTYLSVAIMGTEAERVLYRKAVNGSHAQVRSTESSPVTYNAFDPTLQLWVAACLYRGFLDVIGAMGIGVAVDRDEAFYAHSARLGTTLQVKEAMWPTDIDAFWEYWDSHATTIEIDDATRQYLRDLTSFRSMPKPLRAIGKVQEFLTKGLLPPEFRAAMGYSWSDAEQAKFEKTMHRIGVASMRLPGVMRRFPFNAYLWDVRRRIRHGKPLV